MLYGISLARAGLRDLESEQLVEQENNIVQRNEIKDCFSIISIKWLFFRVLKSYRHTTYISTGSDSSKMTSTRENQKWLELRSKIALGGNNWH